MKKFKPAKMDYTKNLLPQNRRQVFFDVLQLQWKKLLLLGLLLLLFYLPLLLSTVVKDVYVSNLYTALADANNDEKLAAGQTLAILDLLRSLVNILFILVFAVAFSGVLRTVRQYAWEENVHLPTDIGKGIKDNYLQTAAIGALAGLIYTLCLMVYYTASSYSVPTVAMLSMLPIGISVLVILPILMISLAMVPVYSNRLWVTLKNAFFIYTRCLPKVLLGMLCCLAVWLPAAIPNFYCHVFGSVFGVLLTPISLLGWTLLCYNCFDRHLNPIVCPQLVGKGIVRDAENNSNIGSHKT